MLTLCQVALSAIRASSREEQYHYAACVSFVEKYDVMRDGGMRRTTGSVSPSAHVSVREG